MSTVQIKPFNWPPGINLSPRERTDYIVIHHSVSGDVNAQEIDRWHREKGYHGIGYAYVIRTGGGIEAGRPEWAIGAHVQGYNTSSLGICLAGNLDEHLPTPEQLTSLVWLVRSLKQEYPGAQVVGHAELRASLCPGKLFPWAEFKKRLQEDKSVEIKDLDKCWYPEIAKQVVEMGLVSGEITPEGRFLHPRRAQSREEGWLFNLRILNMINATVNLDIPELVKKLKPSVVRIWSSKGIGSGAFITPSIILTNAHVVGTDAKVSVDLPTANGHTQAQGTVIKAAQLNGPDYYPADLALVRVDTVKPFLQLADSVTQGEFCLVLGNPLGEWFSASAGIVTRYGGDLLQVDALVNPGNSGGVVINSKGQILGVPTKKIVAAAIDNHNYSIMVPTIKEFIKGVV